jgi:UDPglucose 6-dehydrogenase
MKITIIGTGHVGLVTGAVFAEKGHDVLCIDNNHKKIEMLRRGEMPFYEPEMEPLVNKNVKAGRLSFSTEIAEGVAFAEVIFVVVGTPPLPTGGLDLTYIEKVARTIASNLKEYRLVVEKSTVPVRTGDSIFRTIRRYAPKNVSFDVASNPEFLREGQGVHDGLYPDRIVIGVASRRAEQILREIYKGFEAPLIVTDVHSAEIIKHAANAFLATKISFINAVANICELAGADVTQVAKGIGMDKRIGKEFLYAGIGYGGSCFPKDVDGFVDIADTLGYDFTLLKDVQQINKEQRSRFVKKVQDEMWIIKEKPIAVWGLSFKPDTDDMREAPSIDIIADLKARGAKLRVYDPETIKTVRQILAGGVPEDSYEALVYNTMQSITLCDSAEEALQGAECLLLLTEWKEFRNIPAEKIKSLLAHPMIIDGRNFFDPNEMKQLGIHYRSIGR